MPEKMRFRNLPQGRSSENLQGLPSRMPLRSPQFLRRQGFTLALLAAVAAAVGFPELGEKGGPLRPETTTQAAVVLIFLLQGLSLPTRQILASGAKFRLHAFCQLSIFVFSPLLMLGLLLVSNLRISIEMGAGLFFLAALPTTISSAIVMTANCDGDASAALFSTTFSNLIGIAVTPIWCATVLAAPSQSSGIPLTASIGTLASLVLLPLLAGQALRPFVRQRVLRSGKWIKRSCNAMILFIVFAAFCQSVSSGVWQSAGIASLFAVLLLTLVFLVLLSGLVWQASRIASRTPAERIAAFFCGSQKTLAAGIPMASALFAGASPQAAASLGLILLPLICYHALQLLLGAAVSPYLSALAQAGKGLTA